MATGMLTMLDELVRCAGCHDQCMTATAEAAASGNQARLVSRVATLALQLQDGRMPWAPEAAESLFYGLNDGLQAEYCIYRSDGHRIEPYLRELRSQAVSQGHIPATVQQAAAAAAQRGNVFGISVPADQGPRGGDVVLLLHDAATHALAPASAAAAARLLDRAGIPAGRAWIGSAGAIEADLGLVDLAESAAGGALDAIHASTAREVVSADPLLVARLRSLLAGRADAPRVRHLAEELHASPIAFGGTDLRVTIHDDGASARMLGLSPLVRELLTRVPGITVLEPVNRGRLASSDGPLYGYPDPALAGAIARRRMEELARTGADLVVTMSPYSLGNLQAAEHGMRVEDLAVFLDSVGGPG